MLSSSYIKGIADGIHEDLSAYPLSGDLFYVLPAEFPFTAAIQGRRPNTNANFNLMLAFLSDIGMHMGEVTRLLSESRLRLEELLRNDSYTEEAWESIMLDISGLAGALVELESREEIYNRWISIALT